MYRLHHLNHHKYNNDAPDPETGTTRDLSSTWRHSRWPGREEGLLSYALLGYFRTDFGVLLGEARKKHLIRQVYVEFAAVLALVGRHRLRSIPWAWPSSTCRSGTSATPPHRRRITSSTTAHRRATGRPTR